MGAISALLNRFLPWIILLSIGVGWGLSFSLAKIAVNAGGSALGVAFWQSLVSGIFLLVYSLSRYGSLGIERHHIRLIVTVTLTGALVPGVIFYMALVRVSPGVLAITDALVPIITYAFTVSLGLERPSLKRFIGVLAGMVGIVILVVPENAIPDRSMIPWILLSCLGAGFYALENMIIDAWRPKNLGPIRLSCGMNLLAAVILLPAALLSGQFFMPSFPFGPLEWSILSLSVILSFSFTAFLALIRISGPIFASQVGYIVTLSAVFWGVAIFSENHSLIVWLSLLVMLLGLLLVTPRKEVDKVLPPPLPSGTRPFRPKSD